MHLLTFIKLLYNSKVYLSILSIGQPVTHWQVVPDHLQRWLADSGNVSNSQLTAGYWQNGWLSGW